MTGTATTKCFADRLQDLIADSGKDMKTLASEIGISSGALSKYQNDNSEPGITALAKIAQYFGVTADYLLGRSNNRTPGNANIGRITGLSDKSIETLSFYSRSTEKEVIKIINLLIEHEMPNPVEKYDGPNVFYADSIEGAEFCDSVISPMMDWNKNHLRIIGSIANYLNAHPSNDLIRISCDGKISSVGGQIRIGDLFPAKEITEKEIVEKVLLLDIQEKIQRLKEGANNADNPEAR